MNLKRINELPELAELAASDNLVLNSNGEAKQASAATIAKHVAPLVTAGATFRVYEEYTDGYPGKRAFFKDKERSEPYKYDEFKALLLRGLSPAMVDTIPDEAGYTAPNGMSLTGCEVYSVLPSMGTVFIDSIKAMCDGYVNAWYVFGDTDISALEPAEDANAEG